MKSKPQIKPDTCPKCGDEIWAVEYSYDHPCHYDGTSEWACKNALVAGGKCDWRVGRFCGKPLSAHECEPPFCTGGSHALIGKNK